MASKNKVTRGENMKRNRMTLIQAIASWTCLILCVASCFYVGGWLMFIRPIIEACRHFDAGTLTGVIIGVTILKCIFASTVGIIIFYVGAAISKAISKL